MLDLDPKHVKIIKKILATHLPKQTIWVYGSRINGKSHEGSDLDLVVIPSDDHCITLSAVRDAFSESNLPILIDILDWNTLPEKFKSEIQKAHEVFQ